MKNFSTERNEDTQMFYFIPRVPSKDLFRIITTCIPDRILEQKRCITKVIQIHLGRITQIQLIKLLFCLSFPTLIESNIYQTKTRNT